MDKYRKKRAPISDASRLRMIRAARIRWDRADSEKQRRMICGMNGKKGKK